jgi:hypothetical protein
VQDFFHIGPVDSPRTERIFSRVFLFDSYYRDSLYPDVMKVFSDEEMKRVEGSFTDGFKHLKYYYPKDSLPEIITLFTGFGYKAFTLENDKKLCLSLEMFLGPTYRYYQSTQLQFSDYQVQKFRKEYLYPEGMKALYFWKFGEVKNASMLAAMINAGKSLFFLDVMSPDLQDSLKMEYTTKQLEWCKKNEGDMWRHFVKKDLFYTTDQFRIAKYIEDAPYTNDEDVPLEAPARIGEWMGWQFVRSYMQNN